MSSIKSLLQTREFEFRNVQKVKVRGLPGKSGASIKFYLVINNQELDIWAHGLYDRENIEKNVRSVYVKIKALQVPLDVDLSHLSYSQQRTIQKILE